ncbi:hypothetical protein FB45DRAFT_1052486 [Roridomyces roridus]|uniref:Uncharacterized protein n=1 Tax=Roridomyces roridus TaxID=1738132 RepID=A0AAD7CA11_9AGAR|nr:hypothetical protein FB45DRAFT_1052486 [Roridomyces roridus]
MRITTFTDIDLGSCLSPTIRTLHIFGAFIHQTMQSTFRAVPSNSRLETITFEGLAYIFPLNGDQTRLFNETITSALDCMSSFRTVQIKAYSEDAGWDGEWKVSMRIHLSSLESRGLLVLKEFGTKGMMVLNISAFNSQSAGSSTRTRKLLQRSASLKQECRCISWNIAVEFSVGKWKETDVVSR